MVSQSSTLVYIEYTIDVLFAVDIVANFFKKTETRTTLQRIAADYLQTFFIFDALSTLTCLATAESIHYYGFKCLRVVRLFQLYSPMETLIEMAATVLGNARPNDLIRFAGVIFYIVYLNHVMACLWLQLGQMHDCDSQIIAEGERCTDSWLYANDFPNRFVDK